jgi:DNA-binding MarR family transcriptional regulator
MIGAITPMLQWFKGHNGQRVRASVLAPQIGFETDDVIDAMRYMVAQQQFVGADVRTSAGADFEAGPMLAAGGVETGKRALRDPEKMVPPTLQTPGPVPGPTTGQRFKLTKLQQKVFEYIVAHPRSLRNDIASALDMSPQACKEHLLALKQAGHIASEAIFTGKAGHTHGYFVADAAAPPDGMSLSPTQRKVLETIEAGSDVPPSRISVRLGMSKETTAKALRQLLLSGLVERRKDRHTGAVLYRPATKPDDAAPDAAAVAADVEPAAPETDAAPAAPAVAPGRVTARPEAAAPVAPVAQRGLRASFLDDGGLLLAFGDQPGITIPAEYVYPLYHVAAAALRIGERP